MSVRRWSPMEGIEENIRSAAEVFERMEREREAALECSRRIIRLSKRAIHAVHVDGDRTEHLAQLDAAVSDMMSVGSHDTRMSQIVQDALMEYAEARILNAAVSGDRVPSPEDLGIGASAWVLGLADSIGELRRVVTSCLMKGDFESASRHFAIMEEVSGQLMLLDVPDAIAPVRRKQDIARGIMDRTRSDMTMASIMGLGRNRFRIL